MEEKNCFISNSQYMNFNLYQNLEICLHSAKSFIFSVAFINFAGVQIILDILKNCETQNIKGKILTTNYLQFTDLKSIEFLKRFKNIEVKFFDSDKHGGFHTKGYIFEYNTHYKAIIGSSNLTKGGLKRNIEWNTLSYIEKDSHYIKNLLLEFDFLWNKANENVTPYTRFNPPFQKKINLNVAEDNSPSLDYEKINITYEEIKPNYMQATALENINKIRAYNENKALCISATGTGKTYLAAFDVRNFKAKKLLFVVHNEEILNSALKSFKKIIPNKIYGKFVGNEKVRGAEYIFTTIQSISRHYEDFRKDNFDYIIIDEAHHITANSYQKILNYFTPKFLLGLTATPERCDGGNIYEVFNMNVPVEIRLQIALDKNLITPFHYFGIKDIDDIDLKNMKLSQVKEITKALNISKRVDFIIEKMNFYGFSGDKRKVIGFCISIEQCKYMSEEFNKRDIKSTYITGEINSEIRKKIISEFENTDLETIFVVDIFNEGVDIPCINTILMLRPTDSPIIFTQQLGRGLRHFKNKEFLTVIDFIGNHNKTFLIATALMGKNGYDKESIKLAVKKDFNNISNNLHIHLDEVCKEQIINQLEQENFNNFKYLKEEYDNFKDLLRRIPTPLDYITVEEAPELFRYIIKCGSYYQFLEKVKDNNFIFNESEVKIIQEIERFLPIKRVYEFVIMRNLISKNFTSLNQNDIIKLVAKYIIIESLDYTKDTIFHAMRYLNQDFYDSGEIEKYIKLFEVENRNIKLSDFFCETLKNENFKNYLLEIIDYGLLRYKKEFSNLDYGFPSFKLYQTYNMRDVALLCNYEKKHSAFRGSGLLKNHNDFFLFIELHKEENIKESINYKDKIISRDMLQWQTQNATTQESEVGKNIIFNEKRNINLHIFVRKYKSVDGLTQPFIYIGKGNCVEFQGNKPITTKLKLENILPREIFEELTEKVEIIGKFNQEKEFINYEKYN